MNFEYKLYENMCISECMRDLRKNSICDIK